MSVIHRDGATIYYQVSGSGPAVLLGHSLLCDGRMWERVEPTLAEHHTVINVDVRGHRNSTAPRRFTMNELAQDWIAILDQEKISSAALCGLSMGGMTALRMALIAPERVDGLIIMDSSGRQERLIARLRYLAMTRLYRRAGLVRPLAPAVCRLMFGKTALATRPDLVRTFVDRVGEHDRVQLTRAIEAVFGRTSVLNRLDTVDCPVLVIVGAEDIAQPPSESQKLVAAMPNARLATIPRTGHLSALEQPEIVTELILDFMREL